MSSAAKRDPHSTGSTLQLAGGCIYYEVEGEGYPLVFMHAAIADSTMWDAQVEEFAQRYRVIRYDTRGFGRSKIESVEFSYSQDLYDLLNHLGVEKAHLVGASRGGQAAINFTLEHPEMVSALILVAAGVGGFRIEPTEAEMPLFAQSDAAEEAEDWPQAAAMDVRIWADGPTQPEGRAPHVVREKVRRMCLNIYTNHPSQGKPKPLVPPAVGRLSEINAPTLIILGEFDASPIRAAADWLHQGIADAKKVIIPGTAHMAPMEKPAEFNKIVGDFLGNLDE